MRRPPPHRGTLTRVFAGIRVTAAAAAMSLSAPGPATVEAANAPARIVSLVPAVTETLFAIGAGPRVVGVSTFCDFPEQVVSLPRVGSFVAPVAEAIVALSPDLVITSPTPGNQPAVRAIERAGVRIAVVRSEGGLAEAKAAIRDVASAAGVAAAGADLVAHLEAELEATSASVQGLARPRVAVVVGRDPLVLAGPESYLGELVAIAGGTNVASGLRGRWPRVGHEFLIENAPEVIIDLTIAMAGEGTAQSAQSAWNDHPAIPAVAAQRVYPSSDRATGDAVMLLRPGPRLARACSLLAGWIHPARAPRPQPGEQQ